MRARSSLIATCLIALSIGLCGCAHKLAIGKFEPAPEARQASGIRISDDGTVTHVIDRLEISVRPVTDEELNRQFASQSQEGAASINPYTYGNWKDWRTGQTPSRFTIFYIKVKNYAYPKIRLDSSKSLIVTGNGRQYSPITWIDLVEGYYRSFTLGYAGNSYRRFDERQDILRNTLYPDDIVFSGQERDGYVIFPQLYEDVEEVTVSLKSVALRFDFRGEPTETVDLQYVFQRKRSRL